MNVGFDTMVGAHQLDENLPLSLLDIAGRELSVSDWGKGKVSFGEKDKPPTTLWSSEAQTGMLDYCTRDVGYTYLVYGRQRRQLLGRQRQARLMKYGILPALAAYARMEETGMWVDPDRLSAREVEFAAERERLHAEVLAYVPEPFRETADFNNAPFLRRWIFGAPPDGLGLTPLAFTEKTGLPQVDDATLRELEHPAMEALRQLRDVIKIQQFFVQWRDWVGPDHRLHPYYNLTGTVTGRRSSSNPNVQQVPRDKRVRSIIGAPPGWLLLECDFSAIEVRLAAWLAGDRRMLELFAKGIDPYRYVVAAIIHLKLQREPTLEDLAAVTKQDRQKGKAVVLGFQYGLQAGGFGNYAKAMFGEEFDRATSEYLRNGFFALFPDYVRWHQRAARTVRIKHEAESPVGRVRHLRGILSFDGYERSRAERQAINSPVQGLGGDLTMAGVVALTDLLDREEARIVGDIHDAILFEVREDRWRDAAAKILPVMEHPPLLDRLGVRPPVRLKAEAKIGTHWGDPGAVEFALEDLPTLEWEPNRGR